MFITIGREDWPCSHEIVAAVHGLVYTENLDKSLRENYRFSMVIESIRKFNHAVPFVPYEIHTVSGETYEVPHPDFISIAPRRSFVVLFNPKDRKDIPHHKHFVDRACLSPQRAKAA